jgi:catechol 2,3-dioxygenase-like lactoylglutathione lyase family enzyme
MESQTTLGGSDVIAFAPTTNPLKAREFYESVLGLRLVADQAPFALEFDAHGTMLRVTTVQELKPQPFTILGWRVTDISATIDKLIAAGVQFERYSGINESDPRGIWNSPGGARVAWFKDPDGNVLSLTEFAG